MRLIGQSGCSTASCLACSAMLAGGPLGIPSSDTPFFSPDFAATPPQAAETLVFSALFEPPHTPSCGGSKSSPKPQKSWGCGGVAAKSGEKMGWSEEGYVPGEGCSSSSGGGFVGSGVGFSGRGGRYR